MSSRAWGGCAGSGERLAIASDAGTRPPGLHFGQPVTLDGARLTQRRGLTLAPVGWLAGGLDPDFSANADDGSIRG